ncbi:hypothetical protein V6Z12_D13G092800 [Gossypium hirsutum]
MTRWIWMRQWRGLVRGLEQVPNGAYMVDDDSSGEEIMDSDSDYSDKSFRDLLGLEVIGNLITLSGYRFDKYKL